MEPFVIDDCMITREVALFVGVFFFGFCSFFPSARMQVMCYLHHTKSSSVEQESDPDSIDRNMIHTPR